MKLILILSFLLAFGCSQTHTQNQSRYLASESGFPLFDRGPDPSDDMQKELIEIIKDMPYLPGISEQLQVLVPSYKRGQKMRPDFGAMPLRGFLTPNSVSVLVIGQDGTHIAEGANRPGIAGFGGRVHDMLIHMGILEGVLFTNLYVNTISGQYGSRNTPVVYKDSRISYTNVIENRQWLMTHEGAYGKWRNRFISWVIRNNQESLKMVMMLGQAGKDAGANFINSIGGKVGPRSGVGNGSNYKVPIFEMVSAGGNNEWAVPLTADGKDVAEVLRQQPSTKSNIEKAIDGFAKEIKSLKNEANQERNKSKKEKIEKSIARLEKKIGDYEKVIKALSRKLSYSNETAQLAARIIFEENFQEAKKLMVFSNGGPEQNGVLFPQQFGGWDLRTMTVNGKKTRSIKGLKVPCHGSKVGSCKNSSSVSAPNVVFVGSPHPTSLSMGTPQSAASKVERELLKPLRDEMKNGWEPPQPENGLKSPFLANKPYQYGRGIIPPSHGDPGITDLRLLPVSTAKRSGKSVIVIGTRDSASFSKSKISSMEKDKPSNEDLIESNSVLTGRPKIKNWLEKYDRGPNLKYSNLLFKGLDKEKILWAKSKYSSEAKSTREDQLQKVKRSKRYKDLSSAEQSEIAYSNANNEMYKKYGIDAFSFKSHPDAGFFGHYRGTFNSPKVVILADPVGYDSFITSKASTGERGQFLHGLMNDAGIGSQYLVISTVPMGMDEATSDEWKEIVEATKSYRDNLFKELMKGNPVLVADGKNAQGELKRITGKSNFVSINISNDYSSDMKEASGDLSKALSKSIKASGDRVDIPREHLTWIARVWEGTSGDRVITATDSKNKGKAFAIVAPNWARKNTVYFSEDTRKELRDAWSLLVKSGEPIPGERLSEFASRRKNCSSEFELEKSISSKDLCFDPTDGISFPSER